MISTALTWNGTRSWGESFVYHKARGCIMEHFPLVPTYLHPKPCYPLRSPKLWGYSEHHHRQRGHPSWGGCSVTVGFSFARLISNPHAHKEKLRSMSKCSQLQSPPSWHPASTLSTAQNRSRSRAGASAGGQRRRGQRTQARGSHEQ